MYPKKLTRECCYDEKELPYKKYYKEWIDED